MISQETIDTCITFQFKSYGIHMSRGITHLIFAPLLVLKPLHLHMSYCLFCSPLSSGFPLYCLPKSIKASCKSYLPLQLQSSKQYSFIWKTLFEGRVNY